MAFHRRKALNMPRRIAIIQGNPDPRGNRYTHALADAYAQGAQTAGHEVRIIDVGQLDFPLLRSKEDFEKHTAPAAIQAAQQTIDWAEHLVFFHPLWLGAMPALLKAFLEQVFRPGFAYKFKRPGMPEKLLGGKSARIVVTMGMPAFVYRWYFRAHSLKSFKRNILMFCGVGPVRATLIGMVEAPKTDREKWLGKMRELGRAGK